MSEGVCIIANDNDQIEYIRIARVAARLATKHLGLPVTLITDQPVDYTEFNQVINVDRGPNNRRTTLMNNNAQSMDWYNLVRTQVYNLSPYDRTLVIDADFFIMTDALKSHVNASFDFAIAKQVHVPSSAKTVVNRLGKSQIPHMWATVMIFNKSESASSIFQLADHIVRHYRTYAKIYEFDSHPVRNDYAFSIACHLLSGYGMRDLGLRNYKLTNVNFVNKLFKIKNNRFAIQYEKRFKDEYRDCIQLLPPGDVHILNKLDLMNHIESLEQL